MKIERLTTSAYRERELSDSHPLAQLSARLPMHHFTVYGKLVAWDARDRFAAADEANSR